jgi:hypothetical protein
VSEWRGKKVKFKVRTMCDFSQAGRAEVIAEHRSFASAGRQYPRLWGSYGRMHGHRVWQEVIGDAKNVD